MSKIKLQKGDYVVHDKMTLEEYERFHEESINQGYGSYGSRAAEERYGDSYWKMSVLGYADLILGSRTNPSWAKRDVTEYFTQEQQEPTANTMSMNIYTSIDTVTMDGAHVSYSFMLEETDETPLIWTTAMDEYIGILKQAGYVIDNEQLVEWAENKQSVNGKSGGGYF